MDATTDARFTPRRRDPWFNRVDAALPPPCRLRPRDPDEADFLREIGTPAELIGPVPERDELDAIRAVLDQRLPNIQAVERWLWYEPSEIADGRPPVALLLENGFDRVFAAADALPRRAAAGSLRP